MRFLDRLRHNWSLVLASAAVLGALALVWLVRDTPLQPAPGLRVDGLSAFFIFALFGSLALVCASTSSHPPIDRPWQMSAEGFSPPRHQDIKPSCLGVLVVQTIGLFRSNGTQSWRALGLLALLVVAFVATPTPVIAGAYAVLALLAQPLRGPAISQGEARPPSLGGALRRAVLAAPDLIAVGALLVGYGALALRGALSYDARTAGAALDGFVFWFVLLAACVAIAGPYLRGDNRRPTTDDRRPTTNDSAGDMETRRHGDTGIVDLLVSLSPCLRIAWLYPLVRLYSLGPWNNGWSFATVLLGGAAALWAAGSALVQTEPVARSERVQLSYLGLALAGFGLGTSAGVAAGCYAVLVCLLLAVAGAEAAYSRQPASSSEPADPPSPKGTSTARPNEPDSYTTKTQRSQRLGVLEVLVVKTVALFEPLSTSRRWLLSGAIPLTAPFVAAWLLIGAGQAGGVIVLSGVAWAVTLLNALATGLATGQERSPSRPVAVAAAASVVLGIGAPLVMLALIRPVVEQLQGGLTLYGDVDVWPWVGLATFDAGHRQVATLPSIVVAGLMLVLAALVYLIVRLREVNAALADPAAPEDHPDAMIGRDDAGRLRELLARLRTEVPWLGGASPSRSQHKERPVDGE